MRSHVLGAALMTAVAVLGPVAPSAHAGGWAVTTLDPIAAPLRPGTTVTVGYTVRQHGRTPIRMAGTGLEIRQKSAPKRFFAGRPQGPAGHYVARIRVPAPGATWTARQGFFAPQDLGPMPIGRTARIAAAGQALFSAKGCVGCHAARTLDGDARLGHGIPLAAVPAREGRTSRDGYLRESIVDPGAVIAPGGNAIGPFPMPALALSDREVDALVSYLLAV